MEWLQKYLNVYWLRPETAMWRTLSTKAIDDIPFEEPILDIGCGDGTFGFMLTGGEFAPSFDAYVDVDYLDSFFNDADIYNTASEAYQPEIKRRPDHQIAAGVDLKEGLLEKASRLDCYDILIKHDCNEPLPFADDTFETIYTNVSYFLNDLETHFSEMARVLSPDGTAIVIARTPTFRFLTHHLYDSYETELGTDWIDMIDLGRRHTNAHLLTDEEWSALLTEAGLSIEERRTGLTWAHAAIWDVGLRPISPHLVEMANSLPPERRQEIKTDWVDTWESLLEPLCDPSLSFGYEREAPEISYVLETI
jgi:SAM-dependent methyltransferase